MCNCLDRLILRVDNTVVAIPLKVLLYVSMVITAFSYGYDVFMFLMTGPIFHLYKMFIVLSYSTQALSMIICFKLLDLFVNHVFRRYGVDAETQILTIRLRYFSHHLLLLDTIFTTFNFGVTWILASNTLSMLIIELIYYMLINFEIKRNVVPLTSPAKDPYEVITNGEIFIIRQNTYYIQFWVRATPVPVGQAYDEHEWYVYVHRRIYLFGLYEVRTVNCYKTKITFETSLNNLLILSY